MFYILNFTKKIVLYIFEFYDKKIVLYIFEFYDKKIVLYIFKKSRLTPINSGFYY